MNVSVAVCQHLIKQQLHALCRGKVLLPVVVNDSLDRAVDVVVSHALVVEQPRDPLAHAALGANVLVIARLMARPADKLAAALSEAHFLRKIRRRFREVLVQLRVVELEGVHAPLADACAVSPVDVLARVHAVDLVVRIHRQRSVVDLL